MPSDNRFLTRLRLELAYFSGLALAMQRRTGGAGVVLRFQRVHPRRAGMPTALSPAFGLNR